MTASPKDDFTLPLSAAVRVLTLGRALSPSQPASLSRRAADGFWLGTLAAAPGEQPRFLTHADAEGTGRGEPHAQSDDDLGALHASVFAARPEAEAVILIRAPRLAAWGLSSRPLPVRYFQMFSYTRARQIPVSASTPEDVRKTLDAHPDAPALLLKDGCSLIWGPSPERAVRLVLSLEEAAQVTTIAERLGGAKDYPADAREKIFQSLQAQARR